MAYMGFLCSKRDLTLSSPLTDYDKTMIPPFKGIEKKEENVLDVTPCDILSLFSFCLESIFVLTRSRHTHIIVFDIS